MDASLLVSLSGVEPRTLDRCADLAAELDARGVPLSMLFTPSAGDGSRRVTEWMRDRVCRGDAVLLHGYDRRVRAEFASLRAHEARLRLIAATAALEREGLHTDAFAPPRWRISREGRDALRQHGFTVCAEESAVRDLRRDVAVRSRVHGFTGCRQATETVRCFALVLSAARAARRGGLVRLGVAASDLGRPGRRQAFLDAVDVALEHGACGRTYLTASPARLAAAP
ncbi:DUF2334 domain-containing protein [Prauserella oleivorans]|uniref:DUF2334 domain-containing protein n=1 Tax=Prauserella oleivorans TaxID=1478153 RepID=A0ABW5WFQ9_9PSEU